jgi:endoglycosylceramidase
LKRAALLVALIVAVSGTLPAAQAGPVDGGAVVAPSAPVLHAGRWLVDDKGRVLVVHGVNMPTKWGSTYPAAVAFGDDDAELLASAGFNAVRLTVERYAVEPAPGRFDDAYIAHFADTMAMLARHGILSLIDFHQDEYGPVFHDNGFPEWMTMTDGLPNLYQVGFPFQYLANPALNRAYDHFWANDVGPSGRRLQDDDARILSRVAGELAHAPGLLGFEVINEPWPGSQYPACYVPGVGCPVFDRGPYSAYNARAIAALRAADAQHLIWYEPLVSFNYGIPTSMQTPRDPRLGFSFHDYPLCGSAADQGIPVPGSAPCGPDDAVVLSNAVARSASTGDALLLTEFGATRDVTTLEEHLQQFDAHMIPWMFWSYDSWLVA